MAEKAIRLGGESTAAAITQTVDGLYPEHKFNEADFTLKHNDDEIAVDSNFAAQSFWKDARIRFLRKKSAVLGLILIVFIVLLAIFGPGMNSYTYSGQELSQKNFAPRVPGIESFGLSLIHISCWCPGGTRSGRKRAFPSPSCGASACCCPACGRICLPPCGTAAPGQALRRTRRWAPASIRPTI